MNALFQYSLLMLCQKIFLEALQTRLRLADFQLKTARLVHLQTLQDDLSLQGSLRQAQSKKQEQEAQSVRRGAFSSLLLHMFPHPHRHIG